jgi:tetratricopeptide (TPR) repeat protein
MKPMNRYSRFIIYIFATLVFCLFYSPTAFASSSTRFFDLGVAKVNSGNYQEALINFTEAIEEKNNLRAAYSNRCLVYLQLEKYENAVSDCTKAINLSPNNTEAYLNRGLAYFRLGNYQASINDNNQVIILNPRDFRPRYNRGITYASLGKNQEAIKDYNFALSEIPSTNSISLGEIYNDRGLAFLESHDIQAAKQDFSLAIRLNQANYRPYFNRGCAIALSGDYKNAVRDFGQVILLNPNHAQAYLNRGVAYHRLGYQQAAIADLQMAAKHFEEQGQIIARGKALKIIKVVQQKILNNSVIALR